MTTNYVFFISKKIFSKKQILQVIDMCYDARPIFIVFPQSIRSAWYPKEINDSLVNSFLDFR